MTDVTQSELENLASVLWNARVSGSPCKPPSELLPGLSPGDAYAVSGALFGRRLSGGARAIGRKIGLTSLAVQTQLGVSEPDFGYLTSDMQVPDGGILPAGSLIQGKVEGEVAFVLKRALRGPAVAAEDVIAATDHVVACIEIIDSRVENWRIRIGDTIADNASSAYFVLGSVKRDPRGLDLRMAGMSLRKNGSVESTGVGAACLDHPANAVAWLANALAAYGDGLSEGDIILSGAYGPVVPFAAGDRCEVAISGLGTVSCAYGRPS
jgi:2-oxopent-4-enoate/cis-2-oxohex-4-enoate hydratase